MKMQMRRMFAGHCRGGGGGGALAAATVLVQCIAVSFFDFISDLKTKDNY